MSSDKVYIAIDLKSFYASVECIERKLNPMTTNLVVAYMSRTEKTIGLAVSPSLKSFGILGRPRLFEVVQKVKEANAELLIRRINISVNRLIAEREAKEESSGSEQLSIFVDYGEEERKRAEEKATLKKEKQMQTAIIDIKKRYGKNAILKGMNLEEGATAKDRNSQIGGHKA